MTKLSEVYHEEILKFGHENFREVLKMCQDRRVLFKLIKNIFTFDQFITRVICESQGFIYLCKDDLIERGVSLEFFVDDAPEDDPLSPYGVQVVKEIRAGQTKDYFGAGKTVEELMKQPEFIHLSEVEIRSKMLAAR